MARKILSENPREHLHGSGFLALNDHAILRGEPVEDDQALASTLPPEHSAIDQSGHMDHHRKPIISIHGKDVQEHELDHKSAA